MSGTEQAPPVPPTLADRRIIVTGAATGLGAAALRVFGEAGARVHATYHRSPPAEGLTAEAWHRCDLRDPAQVTATFEAAAEQMGGLDVLLHAAGAWQAGGPDDATPEELDFLFGTNVNATVYADQAAYRIMRSTGGAIVNFGSSEGVSGSPHSAVYAASKAAVHAWTRSAARAWGADRVTVNSVAPIMETRAADRLRDHLGPEATAEWEEGLKTRFAIGDSFGDPVRDLGPLLVFLAGTGAGFITGQLIAVNGGLLMLGA